MAIGTINGISSNDNSFELIMSVNCLLIDKNQTTTVTVTTPSDGQIYVTSSNSTVANVSANNNVITINTLAYGSVIITVAQATGTGDYASITPETNSILLICQRNIGILNNTEWSVISEIAQEGTGSTYWSIGDMKEITLNGNIGDYFTATNLAVNVFIIHFNYPMNNVADNNIIFHGWKNSEGTQITLVDQCFRTWPSTSNTIPFSINHYWNAFDYEDSAEYDYGLVYNFGGWKGCDFRYDILGATDTPPSDYGTFVSVKSTARVGYNATSAAITNPVSNTLMAALPADFRSVLRLWSRWLNADGTTATVEETIDAITLLGIYEIAGTLLSETKWSAQNHTYESNYLTRMQYYEITYPTADDLKNNLDTVPSTRPSNWTENYGIFWSASPIISSDNYSWHPIWKLARWTDYDNIFSYGLSPAFKV